MRDTDDYVKDFKEERAKAFNHDRRYVQTEVAEKHKDRLPELKKYVEAWHDYWQSNAKRYHDFMKFVFDTSLSADDIAKLKTLAKPCLEFNTCEAYVSRLRGEFAENEPNMDIRIADGVPAADINPVLLKTVDVVEDHVREIFSSVNNDNFQYNVYSDILGGGYSVVECFTDYINELSFEQNINLERVFDPTMCGFDPLAKQSHKGDGAYCFKLVPKLKEDFIAEYGEEVAKTIKFTRNANLGQFNWSYKNQKQDIVLVACIWIKEHKKEKIVKLSNGKVILKKHYKDVVELVRETGPMVAPPIIIEERTSHIETICRYDFCESKVLAYYETSDKYLPLIFIDGNSINIQDNVSGGPTYQMTRPCIYHARGIQQLRNFAGQTVANEIETMVQHKWVAALESIPDEYKDAYTNPQEAQVLVFRSRDPKNPDIQNVPPREVQRTPTPEIVQQIFMGSDAMTQSILGSYDAQLGIQDNDLSGTAIKQGAMHSNAVAVPYLMGYYKGLNRIAQIILDLIPKIYVTPRSIPVRKANGLRSYQIINDKNNPESITINYKPNSLQVKIEPGVNTSLQKQMALDTIIKLMGVSEAFAGFMNTRGLSTILENVDIRGIDKLKEEAQQFIEEQQQAAQQQKPDPMQEAIQAQMQVEMAKVEQKREEAEQKTSIQSAEVAIMKQRADTETFRAIAEMTGAVDEQLLSAEKANAAMAQDAVSTAIDVAKHHAEEARAQENHEMQQQQAQMDQSQQADQVQQQMMAPQEPMS